MAFKFVIFCAALAAVNAGIIEPAWQPNPWNPHATLVQQPAIIKKIVQAEEPANYQFNYDVHDQHTGDIKRQHEVAKDGAISGEYSLYDADGFRRVVTYTADDHHGFQANVQREPLGHKVVAAPVVTKVIQPATVTKVIQPAVAKVVTPVVSHGWQQPNPHASNPWG